MDGSNQELLAEINRLKAEIRKLNGISDAMADSLQGLNEIIEDMGKEARMLHEEIKGYIRGDIMAEVRLDNNRRVVIERGLYDSFYVGRQKHFTRNASCPWDYMCNGWKWEDVAECRTEKDAKDYFVYLVKEERKK